MQQKRLLLLLALLLTAATGAWAQPWTSGDCTVTLSNGTLTISGTGAMADYTKVTEQPWASNRNSITSIVVGEGVTHIGNFALMGCTKATSVSLPSSLTSIGASAFRVCNNAGFTSIAIPANVETIGDNAFHTCNKLTQVNIPDKVTSIGQNAFYGCTAVTSITVGKSVTSIGEVAFRNCSAMTTLAVKAPACALGTNALDACSSLTTIYVTTDKADYYKTADGWSAYAAKIQAGYDISLKEGTEDAYKWAIMPGLAAEGQTVTLQYNGRLKVKSVTATTDAEPAKEPATVTTAPTGAAIVGVGKTTALVSGGEADGGTLRYAVTTTNTKPTSTDGFSDAVPTAQTITASGKVYVWYYVKGDDTHSDSEIAATAIEVPVADIVWDATNVKDIEVPGTIESYVKEGVTLSANADRIGARWEDNGNPTTDGIFFYAHESGGFTFTAPTGKKFTKIEMKPIGPAGWYEASGESKLGTGWAFDIDYENTILTVTWNGSAASTVDLLTGADRFNGHNVKYIAFYLSE